VTVLVAGAGPVGLTAALVLAQGGAAVRVLERRPGLGSASRASTFHPPTLEVLDRLGVLDDALPLGHRVDAIQYHEVNGRGPRVVAHLDLGLLAGETPYPFRLHLEQGRLTPLLLGRLRALGGRVTFDAAVEAVETGAGGVRATVRRPGRVEVVEGAYLVAADGAHSAVRGAAGIAFEPRGYPHRVRRLMTPLDLGGVIPGLAGVAYLYRGPESVSLLRMPDGWRVVFRLPAGTPDDVALHGDRIAADLGRFLPGLPGGLPVASADVYEVSQGVAAGYRAGRVLLAGDAAHLTNTRGGMNMNCGLHDAAALGGALLAAARGDGEALDAYARERRRVAVEALVPRTDRTVSGGADWLAEVRALAADRDRARAYLRRAAMLDMVPGR
jgi:2-polyprenyl-6-methoxyphenol hydroxylase-like FAD-dependent oxidoreductase